jgi:Zn-dependent metalloprotease
MKLRAMWVAIGALVFGFIFWPFETAAYDHRDSLTSELLMETNARGRVFRDVRDGRVRFFGADRKGAVAPLLKGRPNSAVEAGQAFLSRYRDLFGLREPSREMKTEQVRNTDDDRSIVRYQQLHEGVPVVGGELIVQTTGAENRVLSAGGKVAEDLTVDVAPRVTPQDAQGTALALVSKYYGMEADRFSVSEPELWVYDPRLLGGTGHGQSLVWRMEVTPAETFPIRELVLIDAHRGSVALHFNQTDAALNRMVYDAKNMEVLPGNLVLSEGQPLTGDADADNAYRFSGDTFNFYSDHHGRDSINGAGMPLKSTVHYGSGYENAFWDGTQMVYGDGFVTDDVAAHEMTHGVTEHESRLFYYYQSGAINEALSDIWGEFVDLTNGIGNDSDAVRWLIGEDLPIGAIRSMKSPGQYGQPERMRDSYYYCGSGDNGGVHDNAGVASKAAYLLTEGGTFNGYTIRKLSGGIPMVAKLFYEVQTNLLTSASDYQDLYNALIQAADNLGFDASDRQAVVNAVSATEMNQQPGSCPAAETPAPVCTSGQTSIIFSDDFENPSSGIWRKSSSQAPWYYPQNNNPDGFDATYATSGQYNLWGDNADKTGDHSMGMSRDVSIPTSGSVYLQFNHAYSFETSSTPGVGYDGGVVEYSTDGGGSWTDADSLFTHNGYNQTISTGYSNPLKGRKAFSGSSRGYLSSRLDISSLAGKNVRFRFRIGTDEMVGELGWFIDDITIFACGGGSPSTQITVTSPNGAEVWMAGSRQTISWKCSPEAGKTVRVELWRGGTLVRVIRRSARYQSDGSGSLNWRVPRRLEPGGDYSIRITGKTSGIDVSDTSFAVIPFSR